MTLTKQKIAPIKTKKGHLYPEDIRTHLNDGTRPFYLFENNISKPFYFSLQIHLKNFGCLDEKYPLVLKFHGKEIFTPGDHSISKLVINKGKPRYFELSGHSFILKSMFNGGHPLIRSYVKYYYCSRELTWLCKAANLDIKQINVPAYTFPKKHYVVKKVSGSLLNEYNEKVSKLTEIKKEIDDLKNQIKELQSKQKEIANDFTKLYELPEPQEAENIFKQKNAEHLKNIQQKKTEKKNQKQKKEK